MMVHFGHAARVAVLAATIFLLPPPAHAQPQPPPPPRHPLPSDAALDGLWASRNWNGLGAALTNLESPADFVRSMDWLHTRLDAGGGLMLGLLYARDLWSAGLQQNAADPARDLRMTAGMITLYTYEIIVIDGLKCADKSAPGHRVEQLLGARRDTLAWLRQQPQDAKIRVVAIAIALEHKTASARREDDLICRGGLEETRASLDRGTQHEVPNPGGALGKTVDVRPPANWVPRFVGPEVYQPLQDKARGDMRTALLQLIA